MKTPTLCDLNMKYVRQESNQNEEIDRGAILKCGSSWAPDSLSKWLPDYDFEMLETVKCWLNSQSYIDQGSYLAVWWD